MKRGAKTLHVGVNILDDAENAFGEETPHGLRIVVTQDYLTSLRRLRQMVVDNDLAFAERYDFTPQWLSESPEGNPHPERIGDARCCLGGVRIVADSGGFWYEAYLKQSDIRIGSQRIGFKDLFDIPSETKEAVAARVKGRNDFLDQFDAIEVQPVREDKEGNCETCPIGDASFFSVYAHLRSGGVECLGDCEDLVSAVRLGTLIASGMGVPFCDLSEPAPGPRPG